MLEKRKTLAVAILLILSISTVSGAVETRKPTVHADAQGATTNPGQAYDFPGYNDNTTANTTLVGADPSITFYSWESASKQYDSLALEITVASNGFSNSNWAVYYNNDSSTACDSNSNILKPSGSENYARTNISVSLPTNQDLSLIELCFSGSTKGQDSTNIGIYDIRTEGTYTPLLKWRAQQESRSAVQPGDTVELSAQALDPLNLSHAILATNETGVWENRTSYGSPMTLYSGNQWTWANFTWSNTYTDRTVGWKIWFNSTNGRYNSTGVKTFRLDSQKPGLTIHSPSNNTLSDSTPPLEVGSNEKIADWKYSLDGSANTSFEANSSVESMVNGFHELVVWAGDAAGNYNSATVYFTVNSSYGQETVSPVDFWSAGGRTTGSVSSLDTADGVFLNWTGVNSSSTRGEKLIAVNTSIDVPRYAIRDIEFVWEFRRHVENYVGSIYDPGVNGNINYSNGNRNATYYTDSEFARLTEQNQGQQYQFEKQGFTFYLTENESETTFSRLQFRARIDSENTDPGEELFISFRNRTSGGQYGCGTFSSTTYDNFTCSVSGSQINDIVSGDEVIVLFNDTFRLNGEVQSSWRIDSMHLVAEYEDPATGNSFEYEVGYRNHSSGQLVNETTVSVNRSLDKYPFTVATSVEDIVMEDGLVTGFLSFFKKNPMFTSHRALHHLAIDRYAVNLNYTLKQVTQYDLSIQNSTGGTVKGVNLTVFDGDTAIARLTSFGSTLSDQLARHHNYTIKQSIPAGDQQFNVTFRNLNVTGNLNPDTRLVEYSLSGSEPDVTDLSQIYAVDTAGMNFGKATLAVPKNGTPDVILHCTSWDFGTSTCNAWEINDTSDYGAVDTGTHLEFNVSGFDAFGTGNGEPLPNVTSIEIYDVTNTANKRTGGTLVASGLNSTLNIDQQDTDREYRVEFRIRNDGNQDWTLENADELFHSGLNSSWSVGDIWYNLSGRNFGGTFAGGTVAWDTGLGGTLQNQDSNDTMWAKYLVNISTKSSSVYDQYFLVNDTSDVAGSTDRHKLNITKYGFLDVVLETPPSQVTVPQNRTFTVNASVYCRNGKCGTVEISTRYNESSTPDTLIPAGAGSPFHTNNSNTNTCGSLLKDERCFHAWEVNATGALNSVHLIDANASSSYSIIPVNDSEDSEVTINQAILIDIAWNAVDFGVLDPGMTDQPASGNSDLRYNITVEENSLTVDNLWVRGEDLTASGWENPATGSNYSIPVQNISYSSVNDISTETSLLGKYQRMGTSIQPGTNYTTFYWIDVPLGIKTSTYEGNIYFKANGTN